MQRLFTISAVVVPLALFALGCSRLKPSIDAVDRLKPCTSADGPADAYCGNVDVWENRAAASGRKIALKVVILPAQRRGPAPDPLFFLAGGPGQGAAKMARVVRDIFRTLQTDRDLVLVDQRGTGDSNPLNCKPENESFDTGPEPGLARLRTCLAGYKTEADVRDYTTPIAMDDLDDVRRFLGYGKIDLYGGSYGTRAAMVYVRQHPDSVRAVVLDGVAPTDMRLPLYMARDGQRALELLLRDCQNDRGCNRRFPDLGGRLTRLLDGLGSKPQHVKMIHPRTGLEIELDVKRLTVAGVLFAALYSPQTAALVPLLIERAEKGDFQPFLALGAVGEGMADNMSQGMHFSVVCSEDFPRIEPGAVQREAAGTFLGADAADLRMKVCGFWPRGEIAKTYYDVPPSDVAALIFSGELDPVTPPAWGEQIAARWKNARHIVVPGTGHGAISSPCVVKIIREFLNKGGSESLNVECVQRVRRPPFFLGPSGPDPLRGLTQ